ncbi:MAG: tandem-95 repeat protein [Xanthomonadales bacterium]|nr:tandem-95 repeat protein [Xanthomonadales bacterium]
MKLVRWFALLVLLVCTAATLAADERSLPPMEPGDRLANAPLGVLRSVAATRPDVFQRSPLGVSRSVLASPIQRRIAAPVLGVHRGSGLAAVDPPAWDAGASLIPVTLTGVALDRVASVSITPALDVVFGAMTASADGRSITFSATVAEGATPGARRLLLQDVDGKPVPDLVEQASTVVVRSPAPVIESVSPRMLRIGDSVRVEVRGRNLRGLPFGRGPSPLPSISVLPGDGLEVGNDITVSDDGTFVSFTIGVRPAASPGSRVVVLATASGQSSDQPSAANTLTLVDGELHIYDRLGSAALGVWREEPRQRDPFLVSRELGVARGPIVTAMEPGYVSTGTTAQLTLHGVNLDGAAGIAFAPTTGLDVVPGSLVVGATQISVSVIVAADAPLTARRVTVLGSGSSLDAPVLLDVRGQVPEVLALRPNYLARDGVSRTIHIDGARLLTTTGATIVPADDLVIEQYVIHSDSHAEIRLRAAPSAATGTRVVVVRSSSGDSATTVQPGNALYLVDGAQVKGPIAAAPLGVKRPDISTPPQRSLLSPLLGVARGPIATSVSPNALARGQTTAITVSGHALSGIDSLVIEPAEGLSVAAIIASDAAVQAQVNVAADAAPGARRIRLLDAGREVDFVPAEAGLVTVQSNQVNAPIANPDSYALIANDRIAVDANQGVLGNDSAPDGGAPYAVLRSVPSHGVLMLSSDGAFVYTPQADYAGADNFQYSAGVGAVVGAATTVTLTITEPNNAVDDRYSARDNEILEIPAVTGLLSNDVVATAAARIELESLPALGSIAVLPDGGFRYSPDGRSGADHFSYRLVDGDLRSLPAQVTIDVVAVNETPIANDDFYAVERNRTLNVPAPGLIANDHEPDAEPLSLRIVLDPGVGAVSLTGNGGFSYTPPNGFVGQTSFVYEAVDPSGLRDTATVTITVNDSLSPQPDAYVMNEGEVLLVDAPGVLTNDSVIAHGAVHIEISAPPTPAIGTVQIGDDGAFVFRPDSSDQFGVVTFAYRLRDDVVQSAPATVTITIQATNDPPVVVDDHYIADENVELMLGAPGLLGNDTDVEASVLMAAVVSQPVQGRVTVRSDGGFTYVPPVNFRGTESFEYRATDSQGGSSVGRVTVDVTQPPTATNDVYLVDVDTPLSIDDSRDGLLANDHDAPENDHLSARMDYPPSHGVLLLGEDGTFAYTPAIGFVGLDTFGYHVSDGHSDSNVGTVTLAVGITSLPRAYADEYQTAEDAELVVDAVQGVLANDTDADTPRAQLSAAIVGLDWPTPASPLDVTLSPDGAFRFRPPANFYGDTWFLYQVYDGTDVSNTARVRIHVGPVNDGVDARDDAYAVSRNMTLETVYPRPTLGANDLFDGDYAVSFELLTAPQHGTAQIHPQTGVLRYTPGLDFAGNDELTYRLYQPTGGAEDTAVVRLRTNARPLVVPDAYTVPEDAVTDITPTPKANDTDADGDPLAYVWSSFGDARFVALHVEPVATGATSQVTTRNHFYGSRTIKYRVTDGTEEGEGEITFTVTPVPDAPLTGTDLYLTDRDTPLLASTPTQSVLANDFDPDMRESPGAPIWAAAGGVDLLPITAELIQGTEHGLLEFSPVGTFRYTPAAGYSGLDQFTYRAVDGTGRRSEPATARIRVNAPAVAADDAYVLNEDVILSTSGQQGVLANDTDPDGDTLTASLAYPGNTCAPCHGRVSVRPDGGFTYTPDANFNGTDEFYYHARDRFTQAALGHVALVIAAVNDAPIPEDDTYRTREDEVLVAPEPQGILRNDLEVDGDSLGDAAVVVAPNKGVVSLQPDGAFTYTPNANENGRDTFRYRVFDSTGLYAEDEVEVLITAVNDPPVALADAFELLQGQVLQVAVSDGVLRNDSDVDGPQLRAALIAPTQRGLVTLQPDGAFRYVPDAAFSGIDQFQYQIDDGLGALAVATVLLTVRPEDPTVTLAVEDDFYAFEAPGTVVPAPGVLANDTHTGGGGITAAALIAPPVGTLDLRADGGFTYSAPEGYSGTTGFSYVATVGSVSEVAYVTLDVLATDNHPPVAMADAYVMFEDRVLDSRASGSLLANDHDFEGADLAVELLDDVDHGVLAMTPGGHFTYTPTADFNGQDAFGYRVSDGALYSAPVSVSIDVYAQNDAPQAIDDLYQTEVGQALGVGSQQGLLANDTDVDGDVLVVELIDSPNLGQLLFQPDGSFTYQPLPGASGTEDLAYAASDGAARALARMRIQIRAPGNHAPVALADSVNGDEDNLLPIDVLQNDVDPDGDALAILIEQQPTHGSAQIVGGEIHYLPERDYHGSDRLRYAANDGALSSETVDVEIDVAPRNDAPTAVTDTYSIAQGVGTVVGAATGVLSNDLDVEDDALSAAVRSAPAHGALQLAADGGFSYQPHAAFFGRDEFSYEVTDGQAASIGRTIIDVVRADNQAPVATGEEFLLTEDTVFDSRQFESLLANDVDADHDPLQLMTGVLSTGGLELPAAGHVRVSPPADFHGVIELPYLVSDGVALSNEVMLRLTLQPLPDAPVAASDNYNAPADATLLQVEAAAGVLANDHDVDGDVLIAEMTQPPTGGSLKLSASGGFSYVRAAGAASTDQYRYRAVDPTGRSSEATVQIVFGAAQPLPDAIFANGFEQ